MPTNVKLYLTTGNTLDVNNDLLKISLDSIAATTFPPSIHYHDDRYYTETEIDGRTVRKYVGFADVNNSGFSTIAYIGEINNDLNTIINITLSGTTDSTVVAVAGFIIKNHQQDYYVRTESGAYTQVTLNITGTNNGDFWLQVKTNSAYTLNMRIEIESYSNDSVTIGSGIPTGTTFNLEHLCIPHKITVSYRDGETMANNMQVILSNDARLSDSRNAKDVSAWAKKTLMDINDIPNGIARLSSPAFINNPTAPTQDVNNNSTRLATTAYVHNRLGGFRHEYIGATAFANPSFVKELGVYYIIYDDRSV